MNGVARSNLGHPMIYKAAQAPARVEVINGITVDRTPHGNISAYSLAALLALRLGLPATTPHRRLLDELRAADPDGVWLANHDGVLRGLPRTSAANRTALAKWLGLPPALLWPDLGLPPKPVLPDEHRAPLLATARAFRIAVEALPVGKDIRNRLIAHVDAHIAAIEALA